MIVQTMLAQPFAVIGGHDHECLFEHAPTLEVVDQLAETRVQISEAIVVGVDGELPPSGGNSALVGSGPALDQERQIGIRRRRGAEAVRAPRRDQVGGVGIHIV